jgi:ADP-heptose:LPS heptosyltransferase
MSVVPTRHLLLLYCDLLGDYLIIRSLLKHLQPLIRQRFDRVTWVCNPGAAQLAQGIQGDLPEDWTLCPVKAESWMRLNIKNGSKLLWQNHVLRQRVAALGIPATVAELWCPSMAPFEDNVMAVMPKAMRKLGRTLETNYGNKMIQHLIYSDLYQPLDYRQFVLDQHQAFFRQALHHPHDKAQTSQYQWQPLDSALLTQTWEAPTGFAPFFAVFPESAGVEKEWPPAQFGQTIQALLTAYPDHGVVLCGVRQPVAQAILAQVSNPSRIINVVGQTTVVQSLSVIAQAQAVICNDSFPIHAANALGTPFVCLTDGFFQGRYFPYPDRYKHSEHVYVFPPQGQPLKAITPQAVLQALVPLVVTPQN